MLVSINGYLGSGKTLLLTNFAKMYAGKVPIYANYNLKIKGTELINLEDLENITYGLILIDEAYLWLESRESGSNKNKYMSRVIFQSRKRGLDIFTTQQLHGSIDLRYRMLEDLTIYAFGLNAKQTAFDYVFAGWGKYKPVKLSMDQAKVLFDLYDTFEFPDTVASVYEPKKYNKMINKVLGGLRKKFGEENMLKIRFTQNMIKDFMMEKSIYDKVLSEGVHARLQRLKIEDKLKV